MSNFNWPHFGHDKQIEMLEKDIKSGNLAHAYLFLGPEKIGKFTVAKAFAKNLQMQNMENLKTLDSQIEKENHTDTFFWRDNGESIKVEEVREMIGTLNMGFESNYRIWLVQGAGRFTMGAANALLKTLEEPIENVVFIFTAEHITDLPSTIVSRMRLVYFQNIPLDVLKDDLKKHLPEVSEEKIDTAIRYSLGKPGWALRLLSDPREFEEERNRYQRLEKLFSDMPIYKKFSVVDEILKICKDQESDAELIHFFENCTNLLHANLHKNINDQESAQKVVKRIENIYRARMDIGRNINKKLVLEHLVLNF